MLYFLPSSSSLFDSCSLWYLCDFISLVFGTGLRISYDPFEEESGESANEETLLCFTLSTQDPPGVEESPIVVSIRYSLAEEEGILFPAKVSWGSEIYSTRVTSFMMISPSSAFKTLN